MPSAQEDLTPSFGFCSYFHIQGAHLCTLYVSLSPRSYLNTVDKIIHITRIHTSTYMYNMYIFYIYFAVHSIFCLKICIYLLMCVCVCLGVCMSSWMSVEGMRSPGTGVTVSCELSCGCPETCVVSADLEFLPQPLQCEDWGASHLYSCLLHTPTVFWEASRKDF